MISLTLVFWPRNQFCTLWRLLQSLTTCVAVFCFNSFSFFACWIMLGLAEQILLLGCTDVYSDSWAFTDGLNCITITYTFLATPPELRSWSNPIPEYCTVYILIYAYIYLYVCIYIYNIYILHVYIISMSMKLKISRSWTSLNMYTVLKTTFLWHFDMPTRAWTPWRSMEAVEAAVDALPLGRCHHR